MSGNDPGMVDATVRRTWNRAKYDEQIRQRYSQEQSKDDAPKPKVKEPKTQPKKRDQKLDLESRIGSSVVVESQQDKAGGFYCSVCDLVMKDSINYLDHLNSKRHARNLGSTLKVEKATVSQVKSKISALKRKKEDASKQSRRVFDIDEEIAAMQEEDERRKRAKKEKRKQKKSQQRSEDKELEDDDEFAAESIDPELQKMMGFSGFGGP